MWWQSSIINQGWSSFSKNSFGKNVSISYASPCIKFISTNSPYKLFSFNIGFISSISNENRKVQILVIKNDQEFIVLKEN